MAKRRLENWIQGYLDYTQRSEAPLQFHFWAAVSAVAGALRRNVYFDQVHFRWHPNFYIVFVAKPGVAKKSSTIDIAMNLLSKIDGVVFGPESTSWQSLVQRMAEARTMVEYPGSENPIPMCAITCPVGEFGTFLNTKDSVMLDHLVSLWDGKTGRFEKSTKTQGKDVIDNPWINIIGGTTPSWIKENFPEYMIGGGFMSRCVFIYGDKPRFLRAYIKGENETLNKDEAQPLLDDLYAISELRGEMVLTSEARAFGIDWYNDLFYKTPEHLREDHMQGYVSRKQTHIHKLAMILSVAEGDSLKIEKRHLESALVITEGVEKDMPKIFSSIGGSGDAGVTSVLLDYLILKGKTSRQALYSRFMHKYKGQLIDQAIDSLKTGGKIKVLPGYNNITIYEAILEA